MIRNIKPVTHLLVCFLFLQSASGQLQKNMADYLKQRFFQYTEAVHREEIFVHTDREEYLAGENMWFNLYLVDRQSNKPLEDDKIAYFELLNPENLPVLQKRIFLDKGFGPGQIQLPDTLSSGTYTIRVYTNWMKNFLPYNCFIKDLKIYNTLNKKVFRGKTYSDNITKGNTIDNIPGRSYADFTMRVNNSDPDLLEIFLNTDNDFRINNSNVIYLFIQTHGIVNHISSEKILTDVSKIIVFKKELVPGINHITVFGSNGQPVCERFIYTPDKNKQLLTVNSYDSYKPRDKVSLDLTFENELSNPRNLSDFSISVSPVTNYKGNMELSDYMLFGSEFGLLPQMKFQGKNINELPPEIIDSLLLTVKSNWIEWGKILSDELPVLRYQVENEDHFLTGKLLTRDKKPADPDENILLSSPGKVAIFKYARPDLQGNFSFGIHIDNSVNDLIIQPDVVTKDSKINIETPFSDKYLLCEASTDSAKKVVPSYISKWSVNYQVNKIYGSSSIGNLIIPSVKTSVPRRFYGKPDVELVMADYIKLPVMQEVFFELLPGVTLKNKKSVFELSMMDPVTNTFYKEAPGMLIDGVIINDPSVIANLDPELVEKIDVVKEKYYVGNYLFLGIVNVITKGGNYSNVSLPPYAIRMPYRVLDPVWSFVSPEYSTPELKDSHIPDFRNTLYWNPSVETDESGKARIEFWTSDVKSDYEINIQGITPEGKLISAKKIFRVE